MNWFLTFLFHRRLSLSFVDVQPGGRWPFLSAPHRFGSDYRISVDFCFVHIPVNWWSTLKKWKIDFSQSCVRLFFFANTSWSSRCHLPPQFYSTMGFFVVMRVVICEWRDANEGIACFVPILMGKYKSNDIETMRYFRFIIGLFCVARISGLIWFEARRATQTLDNNKWMKGRGLRITHN